MAPQASQDFGRRGPTGRHGYRLREIAEAGTGRDKVSGGTQVLDGSTRGDGTEDGDRTSPIGDLDGLARLDQAKQLACSLPKFTNAHRRHVLSVASGKVLPQAEEHVRTMHDGTPDDDGWVVAGAPEPATPMPRAVRVLAGGRPVRLVWRNQLGGLTCEIGTGSDRLFVKWVPAGCAIDLSREAARLDWAAPLTPVPRVIDEGCDATGSWLVTAALPGENAVSERWKADPATAVAAIGSGLRALHDALPLEGCPFSWSAQERLNDARRRAAAGAVDPRAWHPIHRPLGVERALRLLDEQPSADQLVVCHADACAPNTLLGDDGHWSGHVDLGALGVADRWADLAIATWSAEWNYGPGWESRLLDAYGVGPDPERTRYYRLLWDLGP